ncbi:MAG TPA: hypothetical protein VLL52_13510 [Anaerolineae bacterium]|nr:hypothetical protein [Anaerolineae bacterium]
MTAKKIKLLMQWDVRTGMESEYFEFVVNEFIPQLNRLQIRDIQLWLTHYGECEQIVASGITDTQQEMQQILSSPEWTEIHDKLHTLVTNYSEKLIPATAGFQL